MKAIRKSQYTIVLDEKCGRIFSLRSGPQTEEWVSQAENSLFGVPFIQGNQESEKTLPCWMEELSEKKAEFCSREGYVRLSYLFDENKIQIHLRSVEDCGPRSGIHMDWNFFDSPGDVWQNQCMPHILYTDPDYTYAYLVFATPKKQYAALTLRGFCAWRICYSYAGHQMRGFQILTQADDVRTDGKASLQPKTDTEIHLFFSNSEEECLSFIASDLGIAIAYPAISGGMPGAKIPVCVLGTAQTMQVTMPDGTADKLDKGCVVLSDTGIYELTTISDNGLRHTSRVLCHESWEHLFDKVNAFYREHFQDESGAFYRAVWADTLTPNGGVTLEGTAFGNVNSLYSCRSGEFGGFAGWAMMKNCLLFGRKKELMPSITQYIYNWALNRGHESNPYNGSISKAPLNYLGRQYGPYHLFHEINVQQHEAFFMEQLVDFFRLTRDKSVLDDAVRLAEHFICEHMNDGMVVCQNMPESDGTDYSTVHAPICGLIKLAQIIEDEQPEKAHWLRQHAEALADHVYRRGFTFPTEGEPCTEDGSVSCSAITLLWAYRWLTPKPEYLQLARALIEQHDALVLRGADCRQKNSSVRFWETQYESRDWGPSINAGHAWSIWTAEAKALLAEITGEFALLRDSYEGFVTNISKVRENGAMPSCFTPDMIPGTPHAPCVWGGTEEIVDVTEMRPTSTHLALDYVRKTYSCSGNYFLIKAAELWDHICGIDFTNSIGINGVLTAGRFTPAAKAIKTLIMQGAPKQTVIVKVENACPIRVYSNTPVSFDGCLVRILSSGWFEVTPYAGEIRIQSCKIGNAD